MLHKPWQSSMVVIGGDMHFEFGYSDEIIPLLSKSLDLYQDVRMSR